MAEHMDEMNDAGLAGLTRLIGGIDIYLLDQITKGRFPAGARVLDAGCGGGRNITWFLKCHYDVCGIDTAPAAISGLKQAAGALIPPLRADNFRMEPVESLSFPDASFDAVLSIAVLHFARDHEHFNQMVEQMWRVLKPGGILFARLGSNIGIEDRVKPLETEGRYAVPDGSTRYLVDMETLARLTAKLDASLLEPIKTVNVQNMRCMTTCVLGKI